MQKHAFIPVGSLYYQFTAMVTKQLTFAVTLQIPVSLSWAVAAPASFKPTLPVTRL
jgi:hypothetical protein